jgi:Asp-tRNA(Asn)/Glu-tRNA(Gln) amidotransferase A subunit family amidase
LTARSAGDAAPASEKGVLNSLSSKSGDERRSIAARLLEDGGLPLGLQLLDSADGDAALFKVASRVAAAAFGRAGLVGAGD